MRYWRGYLFAAILGAFTLGLSLFAKQYSQLVDAFYPFLTREIQTTLAAWSSTVDVTVWQVAALLIVLGLLLTVVLMVALRWNFFQWLGWVLALASMVWMLHTGVYGLNYYASPLSQDIHLDSYDFTVGDMADATIFFRDKANALAEQLPRDSKGDLKFSDFQTLAEKAGEGFHTLTYEQSGSVFAGSLLPVKELAWADLYTSMGILGITMPITGEAAVNPQIPAVSMPFTMCHEMAHRMCIATEHDANFAAFLACLANESLEFQYSAYYMAYRYCYSALLSAGTGEAAAAAARIDLEVNSYLRYDLKVYDRFFAGNRNELASNIADAANDAYIKVSGDNAGTESYGQVATDLINWYIDVMIMPYIDQREESGFDPLDRDYINGILGNG
ncbi:MAG: DUF3810 family protein [Oscillospiraceae bacterium]|nr:DUF3810 family protein [Oscillospiraceae bacterium]